MKKPKYPYTTGRILASLHGIECFNDRSEPNKRDSKFDKEVKEWEKWEKYLKDLQKTCKHHNVRKTHNLLNGNHNGYACKNCELSWSTDEDSKYRPFVFYSKIVFGILFMVPLFFILYYKFK